MSAGMPDAAGFGVFVSANVKRRCEYIVNRASRHWFSSDRFKPKDIVGDFPDIRWCVLFGEHEFPAFANNGEAFRVSRDCLMTVWMGAV
jgi:hypothetical protein